MHAKSMLKFLDPPHIESSPVRTCTAPSSKLHGSKGGQTPFLLNWRHIWAWHFCVQSGVSPFNGAKLSTVPTGVVCSREGELIIFLKAFSRRTSKMSGKTWKYKCVIIIEYLIALLFFNDWISSPNTINNLYETIFCPFPISLYFCVVWTLEIWTIWTFVPMVRGVWLCFDWVWSLDILLF